MDKKREREERILEFMTANVSAFNFGSAEADATGTRLNNTASRIFVGSASLIKTASIPFSLRASARTSACSFPVPPSGDAVRAASPKSQIFLSAISDAISMTEMRTLMPGAAISHMNMSRSTGSTGRNDIEKRRG